MKKEKIKKLLNALGERTDPSFEEFDRGVESLKTTLKQKINLDTLADVKATLAKFQKKISFDPLLQAIENIRQENAERETNLVTQLEEVLNSLNDEIFNGKAEVTGSLQSQTASFASRLNELQLAIDESGKSKDESVREFANKVEILGNDLIKRIQSVSDEVKTKETSGVRKEISKLLEALEERTNKNYLDLRERMSRLGGGSMNRQIKVNGTDYLTKYTDINLVGSITAASDDANKRVNITFAGGGGGSIGVPTGTVNGVNTTFTAADTPLYVVVDGLTRRDGKGYVLTGLTIEVDPLTPPVYDIFYIY